MKKLFTSKQDSQYDSFIGKQYLVGDLSLVVEDVIAEGGFSYVFLVKDNTKNKNYALKRMLVNCQTDLDNCKQEITIMKAFHRHPAIVSFKGHHTKHTGNGIYEVLLLMQHYPNGTVVDLMNKHISTGLDEALIRQIFFGIVDAICLLHSNGYTHRDIKVENILIGSNKEYVLCDFGSAYKGTMNPELQGHSVVEDNVNRFTTLSYRAPEMCDLYLGYEIGSPADVWALGVLLYKLCYFITPFDENTLAIARAKYTMPDTASRYSDNLLSVIRETLITKPSDRLTAKQIISRLKEGNKSKKCSKLPTTRTVSTAPLSNNSAQSCTADVQSNRFDSTNEEIKPRSRPRGTSKQIIENFGLIGPPELQPLTSREHSAVLKEHSTMSREHPVAAREHPVAARERPVVTQGHPVAAAQGHPLVAPEHSTPLAEGKNSANSLAFHQNERPRSSEDSRSQLVASLKSSSLVSEDPWGSASTSIISTQKPREKAAHQRSLPVKTLVETRGTQKKTLPEARGTQQKTLPEALGTQQKIVPESRCPKQMTLPESFDTISPFVFLPPPPSSPSHKTRTRAPSRGHLRTKSDTTFFQDIVSSSGGCPGGGFYGEGGDGSTSSSSGELTGGVMKVPNKQRDVGVRMEGSRSAEKMGGASSSEANFVSCGSASIFDNKFDPKLPPPVDEFLNLRTKESSQTRLDEVQTTTAKSNKVERSQTFSHSPASSRPRPVKRPVVVKRANIISQGPQ